LGVALFAHLVAFFGVNYWDQMVLVWYLALAFIASAAANMPIQSDPEPVSVQ